MPEWCRTMWYHEFVYHMFCIYIYTHIYIYIILCVYIYIIPLTIPPRRMVGVLSHRKTFYSVRIGGQALILLEDTLISRSHISILLEPASATQAFYKMHGLHYLNQQVLLRWKETGSIKSIVSTYLMHRFCPEPMLWKTTITNKMLKPYSLMSQVLKSNGLNLFE